MTTTAPRAVLASSEQLVQADRIDRVIQAVAQLPETVTATICG